MNLNHTFKWLIPAAALTAIFACQETYENPIDPDNPDSFPEAPFNVQSQVKGDSVITLLWEAGLNYGFSVLRGEEVIQILDPDPEKSAGGTFSFSDEARGDQKFNVNADLEYTIKSRLPNGNENGASVTVRITFDHPSGLVLVPLNDQQIRLNWSDNLGFELGYRVYRKKGTEEFLKIADLPENSITFSDNEPPETNVPYSYYVEGFTSRNEAQSETESITIIFLAPTDLTVQIISPDSVKLDWSYPNGFQTGFRIEEFVDGTFTEIASTQATDRSYVRPRAVEDGNQLRYRISAITPRNQSPVVESEITAQFKAPDNLRMQTVVDGSTNSVRLSWNDNSNFETAFVIERRLNDGVASVLATVAANDTTYLDTDYREGNTVDYRVKAIANTRQTTSASTGNVIVPPKPVTNLTATTESDGIKLTWITNSAFPNTTYRIERSDDDGVSYETRATVTSGTRTYTDVFSFTFGSVYVYRIIPILNGAEGFIREYRYIASRDLFFRVQPKSLDIRFNYDEFQIVVDDNTFRGNASVSDIVLMQRQSNGTASEITSRANSSRQIAFSISLDAQKSHQVAVVPKSGGITDTPTNWITISRTRNGQISPKSFTSLETNLPIFSTVDFGIDNNQITVVSASAQRLSRVTISSDFSISTPFYFNQPDTVFVLARIPGTTNILAGTETGKIRRVDTEGNMAQISEYTASSAPIRAMAINDESRLLFGTADNKASFRSLDGTELTSIGSTGNGSSFDAPVSRIVFLSHQSERYWVVLAGLQVVIFSQNGTNFTPIWTAPTFEYLQAWTDAAIQTPEQNTLGEWIISLTPLVGATGFNDDLRKPYLFHSSSSLSNLTADEIELSLDFRSQQILTTTFLPNGIVVGGGNSGNISSYNTINPILFTANANINLPIITEERFAQKIAEITVLKTIPNPSTGEMDFILVGRSDGVLYTLGQITYWSKE